MQLPNRTAARLRKLMVPASVLAALLGAVPVAAVTNDYAMPYINTFGTATKGITLVNSADFTKSRVLINSNTAVIDPQTKFAGTVSGNTILDFRPHTLVYGQANRWRRMSLRGGLQASPVQISNEVAVNSRCVSAGLASQLVSLDLKDVNATLLLYRLPGTNKTCNNADDVFRTVRINDGSGVSPKAVKVKTLDLFRVYSPSGVLLAHYGLERGKLNRHAPTMLTAPKLVKSGVTSFQGIAYLPDGAVIALIDKQLRRIAPNGALVATPIRIAETGFEIEQAQLRLPEGIFFVEQTPIDLFNPMAPPPRARIYRVATGGGAAVRMVAADAAIVIQGFTDARLLFTVGGGFDFSGPNPGLKPLELKSFPRNGTAGSGSPATLLHQAASLLAVTATFQNRVFFNSSTFGAENQPSTALTCLDNASNKTNRGPGSAWVGSQSSFDPLGNSEVGTFRLMLASQGLQGTTRGARLFSLNPANLQSVQLTDLSDNTTPFGGSSAAAAGIGILSSGTAGDSNFDVFAFDLLGQNSAKRFRRLTNNTPADEFPVFFFGF